jgi:hypothetical protein
MMSQAIRDKGLNTELGLPNICHKKRGHFPLIDHEKRGHQQNGG